MIRSHLDRRYECPKCDNGAFIRHKHAKVKALEYDCPECRTKFVDVSHEAPQNPTLPPGVAVEVERVAA